MRYGDFEYQKIKSGIKITGFYGNDSCIEIPKYIEGLPVTEIGKCNFMKIPISEFITKESTLESTLKSLLESTFYRPNNSLTSIKIPDSVTKIGDYVFLFCYNLKKIKFPRSNKNFPSLKKFLKEYEDIIEYYDKTNIENLVALLNTLSGSSKVNFQLR